MMTSISRAIGFSRRAPAHDLETGLSPQRTQTKTQPAELSVPAPVPPLYEIAKDTLWKTYIGSFPAGADLPRLPMRRVLQQPIRLVDATAIGAITGASCALLGAALGRSGSPLESTMNAFLLGALQAGVRHVVDTHFLNHIRDAVGLRALGAHVTLLQAFQLGIVVGSVNTFHRELITSTTESLFQRQAPASLQTMLLTTSNGTPSGTYKGVWLDVMAVAYAPFAEELSNRHGFTRGWFALRRYADTMGADNLVAILSDARALHLAAGLGFGLLHVTNDHGGATFQGISTGVLSSPAYMQLYVAGGYGLTGAAASAGAHFFHNSVATLGKHLGF